MTDRHDPFEIAIPFKGESAPEDKTRVVNLRKALPNPKSEHIDRLVEAGRAAAWSGLGPDEWHTVGHAVTDVDAVRTAIRTDQTVEVFGESAVLTMLRAEVMLTAVFPLLQPRIAGEPAYSRPPIVSGLMRHGEGPVAGLMITFTDEQHLREHLEEQIQGTLDAGSDLRESILSHGVTEPILVYPAVLVVGDLELDVMAAGDGITRCVRSWHNIFGGEVTKPGLAEVIVDTLLTRSSSRRKYTSESGARRDGRREKYLELRARVAAHGEEYQDAEVVRISQSLTMPANIAVGFRSLLTDSEAGAEHLFQDAIGSAVAQIHTLSRPWVQSVIGANVMMQAIQRAVAEGYLDQAVADVARGSQELAALGIDGLDEAPDLGLARAVVLTSLLLNPATQRAVKRNIRSLRGIGQVRKNLYASMLLSVLDQPWRAVKRNSRNNAASAWKAGGPVPQVMHDIEFQPLLVADYVDLVAPARDKEHPDHVDAWATLVVAGGIALTADGLLLSPTGSSAEQAPGRRPPHQRVLMLATTEKGLCALAHAANSFRSGKEASNSYTAAQRSKLNDVDPSTVYVVAMPSEDDVFTAKRDPNYDFGDVAAISNLALAGQGNDVSDGSSSDSDPKPDPRTDKQRAADLRTGLLEDLSKANTAVSEINKLFRERRQLLTVEQPDYWTEELEPLAKRVFMTVSSIADDLQAQFTEDDDPYLDEPDADVDEFVQ